MATWRLVLPLVLVPFLARAEGNILTPAQTASSNQAVADALGHLSLTPVQAISVRAYIGQGKANIVGMEMNGVNILILHDPQDNHFLGEVVLKPDADGSVFISKVTGAEFDSKHEVKVPVLEHQSDEAEQVFSGSESAATFENQEEEEPPAGPTYTMPAVSAEASVQYGVAKESYASFAPDGHGYEYGVSTNIGEAGAGGQAGISGGAAKDSGFAGLNGEIGAKSTKVEVFVNYLGPPTQDADGTYTREVLGGSYEMHGTLANAEAKIGCFEGEGCTAKTSWGLLGIGAGAALNYAPKVTLDVEPEPVESDAGLAQPAPEDDDSAQPEQSQPDQTAPDQPEADQTAPDQTQPDQTAPDQTAPDQPEADQTAPDQTQPDQTAPDQTAPDQTAPDQPEADQTAPDQTQPDQTAPDQTAPDQTAPDQTAPDQPEADQTAPDQTQPDQTAPDQTAPDQTAPDQPEADQTAPDQTAPDQTAPDQTAPDQTAPDQPEVDQTAPDDTQPEQAQPSDSPPPEASEPEPSYTPPPEESEPEPSYSPPPEESEPEPSYSPPPEEAAPAPAPESSDD